MAARALDMDFSTLVTLNPVILGPCAAVRVSRPISAKSRSRPHPTGTADAQLRAYWNLAPTDPIPIVGRDPDDGRLEVVRWRLIRYWAKDIKIGYSTIYARC